MRPTPWVLCVFRINPSGVITKKHKKHRYYPCKILFFNLMSSCGKAGEADGADDGGTGGPGAAADDVAADGAGAEAAANGDGGEGTASTSIINAASGVPPPFLPHVHTAPMSVSL